MRSVTRWTMVVVAAVAMVRAGVAQDVPPVIPKYGIVEPPLKTFQYQRHLQNPLLRPASSGRSKGFCKCLV